MSRDGPADPLLDCPGVPCWCLSASGSDSVARRSRCVAAAAAGSCGVGRPHLLQCRLVVHGPLRLGLPHQSLPRLPGSGVIPPSLRQRISVVLYCA